MVGMVQVQLPKSSDWHRQMLKRRDPQVVEAGSRFVVASFIDQAGTHSTLVEISRLLVVVCYEDLVGTNVSRRRQNTPLRFSGYRVTQMPHGVRWGGAAN